MQVGHYHSQGINRANQPAENAGGSSGAQGGATRLARGPGKKTGGANRPNRDQRRGGEPAEKTVEIRRAVVDGRAQRLESRAGGRTAGIKNAHEKQHTKLGETR